MAAAALALFDEPGCEETARLWLERVSRELGKTRSLLGDDGASMEGFAYWAYGMEYLLKWTRYHNTLLIDGKGQSGEGSIYFPDNAKTFPWQQCLPRLIKAADNHLIADDASAYPASTGLRKFHRHLIYLKPSTVIIIDDIELAKPAKLELRFYPGGKLTATDEQNWRSSALRIHSTNAGVIAEEAFVFNRKKSAPREYIGISTHTASLTNAVILDWQKEIAGFVTVKDGIAEIQLNGQTLKIDLRLTAVPLPREPETK